MKTNLILVGMLLVGLFAVSFAMADEGVNSTKCFGSTDGITKCSASEARDEIDASLNESYSGWKYGWIKTKSWFASDEKKSEMELKLAEMKLIQARIAAKNNNTKVMEKAMEAHEKILAKVQERTENMDGAKDSKGVKNSAEKLVGLDRAIEVHQMKIERMKVLFENENLTAEEKARIDSMIAKAENNTAHLQEVQDRQKEKMKTRLMAVANMSENESASVISEIENAQNLKELKEIRKDMSGQAKEGFLGNGSGAEKGKVKN